MMGIAQHRKPNKIETKLGDLLNKMYPNEWKYTGDFKFIVDGKSPDFTNINDKKKLIELFGDYWHRDDNPDTRISHFSSFGYDTLVIWEHEFTNIENVMNKIRNFQDQP